MKFNDLKFKETKMPKGIQSLVSFGDYDLSNFSYGGNNVLYEIAVFKNKDQVEMPGITEEGDTVKGFLDEEAVTGILKKMHFATGSDPKQVDIAHS